MQNLNFSEKFVNPNPKDLQNFVSYLVKEDRFLTSYINVNEYEYFGFEEVKTMCTVKIKFCAYNPDTQIENFYIWKCYRAKDFCCSNTSLIKIK